MFAKARPQFSAAAARDPRRGGRGATTFNPLTNPYVGVGGAGVLFLAAALLLVAVTGDPRAGAPRVRIPLDHGHAAPLSAPAPGQPDALASSAAAALPGLGGAAALPTAPIAGLTLMTPQGPLPIIGPDGRTPAQAYARPFQDTGKPKVALVVGGLGLNAKTTRQAIEQLPPEVTLSFVPYAEGLQGWIDLARQNGHEVLLEAPMEPVDYPENDPGPYTLMAGDPAPTTVKRLEWLLSRATGYFGLTNYLGGRFMSSDPAMTAFTSALRMRGLAFVDDGQAARRGGGLPRASADRIIDEQLDAASIENQLTSLERTAQSGGSALGSGFSYPVTLEAIRHWADSLPQRGIALAPASALANRR